MLNEQLQSVVEETILKNIQYKVQTDIHMFFFWSIASQLLCMTTGDGSWVLIIGDATEY